MPLYEYLCQDCERESELLVQSGAQPACSQCGSTRLSKLLSVVAAPTRGQALPTGRFEAPPGPCGSSCGCFPQG